MLLIAAAAIGIWFVQQPGEHDGRPRDEGVIAVHAPSVGASSPSSAATATTVRATGSLALPDKVTADVRQAYPLLRDVAFSCDARGCAVTATIPPPDGEAFLAKRQEMLLGGLAKVIAADGYRTVGPVQMEEVDDNLFHIRAALAQSHGQTR